MHMDDDTDDGRGRHGGHGADPDEGRHRHRHHRHGHHRGHRGGRSGRPFGYGELRLLALAMIADEPRHGYELMRAIEERMGGSYSPSPGVIYPTLAWLEDMAYVAVESEAGGRKRYRIKPEGEAFLAANRAALDEMDARIAGRGAHGRPGGAPAPVTRAMENLKLALRLRLSAGALDTKTTDRIAAALDAAARDVEKS